MPSLSEVTANAKKIKGQIAEQTGLSPKEINDTNLLEAQKLVHGAGNVAAQGGDPLKTDPATLKSAADGSKPVQEDPETISKQQKIALAITAIAPTLLGYAFGGSEGGAIGAQVSQKAVGEMGSQFRADAKEKRDLAARKEMQREQLAARAEDKALDRESRMELARENARSAKEIKQMMLAQKAGEQGKKLTKGQEAVDRTFAKEYEGFVLGGGYADVQKSMGQLREAIDTLKNTDSATGPLVGRLPKGLRNIVTPEGAGIQDQVEEVVQRNLRLVLGPQFTEKEGAALIQRAYNPNLSEAENIKRLERLSASIEQAANAKLAAAEYYEENGTLQGYKGTQKISVSDIASAAGLDEGGKGGGGFKNPALPEAAAAPAGRSKNLEDMSEKELEEHIRKLKGK